MKNTTRLLLCCLLLTAGGALAQSGKEKKESLENKSARERERSLGGQRTANELKDDRHQIKPTNHLRGTTDGKNAADTSSVGQGNKSSGQQVVNANDDQHQNNKQKNNNEAGSSSQAVVQSTSSESGSPSILSKNDGKGRDGTNSVQRASPNMAGAKVPGNMNLDRLNRGDKNMNTDSARVAPQSEQPQHELAKGTQSKKSETESSSAGNKQKRAGTNNGSDKNVQKNKGGADKSNAQKDKAKNKHRGK